MTQLLKKDWRVNGTPIFWTIVLFVSLLFLMLVGELDSWHRNEATMNMGVRNYVSQGLEGSADAIVITMMAMAAVFGGVAFATERREQSADFLAMLPIQKKKALLSKIMVATVCLILGLGFAFTLHAMAMALATMNYGAARFPPIADSQFQVVAISGMLFGIAWMLSTFLRIPSLCTGIAIAVAIICPFILDDIFAPLDNYSQGHAIAMQYFAVIAACSGPACFLTGSIYYLKRIEP
jgi:ABC-type transport system involved in multi-copper enzyme maturation permease subunit